MKPLRRRSFGLGCEALESRDNPSGMGIVPITGAGPITGAVPIYAAVATGAAAGDTPYVTVYDSNGIQVAHFLAYDAGYTGGVNVAMGDVNNDGHLDIITAPKNSSANIRVYDGKSFQLIHSFYAFDTGFMGGASITVASLYTQGSDPDIIVGAGAGGGPNVRVFNAVTGALTQSFYAFDPSFRGGVNVAATSAYFPAPYPQPAAISLPVSGVPVSGGVPIAPVQYVAQPPVPGSIIVAAGSGGAPQVTIFNAETLAVQQTFYAYDPSFRGGVNLALAEEGSAPEIITGAGVGGSSNLRVFKSATVYVPSHFTLRYSISVGSSSDTGGVTVGVDGYRNSIFAIANPLSAQSTAKAYIPNDVLDSTGLIYVRVLQPIIYGQNTSTTSPIPGVTNWGHIGSFPT